MLRWKFHFFLFIADLSLSDMFHVESGTAQGRKKSTHLFNGFMKILEDAIHEHSEGVAIKSPARPAERATACESYVVKSLLYVDSLVG